MKKVRLIYDFDGTLSPKFMQEFGLTERLGYKLPAGFYDEANELVEKHDMDLILSAMFVLQKRAKQNGIKLTKEWLMDLGKLIEFYPGIESFFENINEYGKSKGVEIEHYIISSGHREIIEGTSIAKFFTKVYGSFFAYDENGEAFYTSQAINSNNKVQFLFRIEKNSFGYSDDNLNAYLNPDQRFPFENMAYLGDGYTDIPCMRVVKENGGRSVAVFNPNSEKAKRLAEEISKTDRVNFFAPADYSKGSALFNYLQSFIDDIAQNALIN